VRFENERQLLPIAKQPALMERPFAIVVEPVFEMLKSVEVAHVAVEDAIVKRFKLCDVVVGDAPIAKSADGDVVPMPSRPAEVMVVVPVAPKAEVPALATCAKIEVPVAFCVMRLPLLRIVVEAVPPMES
jgi:hypothetical protein